MKEKREIRGSKVEKHLLELTSSALFVDATAAVAARTCHAAGAIRRKDNAGNIGDSDDALQPQLKCFHCDN